MIRLPFLGSENGSLFGLAAEVLPSKNQLVGWYVHGRSGILLAPWLTGGLS